jgi:23S rRNA (uracil1939-C5)-methyltransferase
LAADVVGRFSVRIGLGGDPASGKEPDQVAGVLTLEASAVAPLDASERLALCERALASSPDLVGALMLGPTSGHSRALAGRDYVYERVLERTFRVSAGSFFQVNHAQTPTLVQQALAAARIQSTERVLDGYSGVGLFSLFLAERAQQVWAIESQSSAVADARANAVANGVENVTTMAGHMEHVIGELRRTGERIDVALVDPPRTGCAPRALRAIRDLAPRALVYVSCDPSTLARDLRLFCEEGYQLAWAQPVDMFPFTSHIECVALCERTAEPQSRVI